MQFTPALTQAIIDYSLLLEKGYPEKPTLELLAVRYQLDRHDRAVLYRGVFKKDISDSRRSRLIPAIPAEVTVMKTDFLNQLYSIASYLSGRIVFIAADGLLRDASEFHGAPIPREILTKAMKMIHRILAGRPHLIVEFYLDEQVNAFEFIREELGRVFSGSGTVSIIESGHVDADLTAGDGFLLSTSDSVIIDRTIIPVFDLARFVIRQNFSGKIPDIAEILSEID